MPTRPITPLALAGLLLAWSHPGFAEETTPATSAPPAAAQPAPAVTAAPVTAPAEKLTGPAAWERLKGNTIEGKTGGEAFAEYFDAAGGVRYVDKDGLSTGTWSVQANKVCFDFPDDDDRTCSSFVVTGETGTATDDDGSAIRFSILPGNSKGL